MGSNRDSSYEPSDTRGDESAPARVFHFQESLQVVPYHYPSATSSGQTRSIASYFLILYQVAPTMHYYAILIAQVKRSTMKKLKSKVPCSIAKHNEFNLCDSPSGGTVTDANVNVIELPIIAPSER